MDGDAVVRTSEDGQTIDELMGGHVGLTYKYFCFFPALSQNNSTSLW